MALVVHQLTDQGDDAFITAFVGLRQQVRAPEFAVVSPSDVQTRGLILWGLSNKASFWMIKDDQGQVIARICARVTPHRQHHGTMGMFEINLNSALMEEAFALILSTAQSWLESHDVKEIVAPIDMNTWFSYRFSVFGEKFYPRLKWEPTTPPMYTELFRRHGFKDLALFHTVFFPHLRIGNWCIGTGPMKNSYHHLHKLGFSLREMDKENFATKELPVFHEISHEAFKDSFLFEPIDLQTFTSLYAGALQVYDFSPSSVILSPEGEIAGFIFAFYDGDHLVIKSLALRKKYQGLNLSSGLIWNAVRQSFRFKKKGTISALVKTGIASESIEKKVKKTMWFSWAHYYILLSKELR
jgi:hypothetical protein